MSPVLSKLSNSVPNLCYDYIDYANEKLKHECIRGNHCPKENQIKKLETQSRVLCERVSFLESQLKNVMLSHNLKTLTTNHMTRELFQLSRSLHISDVRSFVFVNASKWPTKKSHSSIILQAIGCFDPNVQVFQLQQSKHGKFPVNIMFSTPQQREIAIARIKHLCSLKNKPLPSLHFSLHGKNVLKEEMKAISNILRKLQNDGSIYSYALNNFQATNHFDKLAPLYTIQLSQEPIFTQYENSNIIEFYQNGNLASHSQSDFANLESLIHQHINSLSQQTIYIQKKPSPLPSLFDYIHKVNPKITLPLIKRTNNTDDSTPPTLSPPPSNGLEEFPTFITHNPTTQTPNPLPHSEMPPREIDPTPPLESPLPSPPLSEVLACAMRSILDEEDNPTIPPPTLTPTPYTSPTEKPDTEWTTSTPKQQETQPSFITLRNNRKVLKFNSEKRLPTFI